MTTTITSSYGEISFWAERSGIDAVKRLLGCALVMIIPTAGLDEALTSLKDMREYWTSQPGRSVHAALPHFVTATAGAASERPDLLLTD
jgi:hypothetical protein